MEIVNIR